MLSATWPFTLLHNAGGVLCVQVSIDPIVSWIKSFIKNIDSSRYYVFVRPPPSFRAIWLLVLLVYLPTAVIFVCFSNKTTRKSLKKTRNILPELGSILGLSARRGHCPSNTRSSRVFLRVWWWCTGYVLFVGLLLIEFSQIFSIWNDSGLLKKVFSGRHQQCARAVQSYRHFLGQRSVDTVLCGIFFIIHSCCFV